MRTVLFAATLVSAARISAATAQPGSSGAPAAPPAAGQQIAAAVAALPAEMREGAGVLGYGSDGRLTTLRERKNEMICLANNPGGARFHVACYHHSLEPFMARGRALRTQGVKDGAVDSARFAEIKAGKLAMPRQPASLYSLTGAPESFNAATGTVTGATPLHVVYIPFATRESTGLSTAPARGSPWLMFPGTPKAHIMFTPSMP